MAENGDSKGQVLELSEKKTRKSKKVKETGKDLINKAVNKEKDKIVYEVEKTTEFEFRSTKENNLEYSRYSRQKKILKT